MVKATNRPLVIDPFLAFHQCLMLILLLALLVVVYYNITLKYEKLKHVQIKTQVVNLRNPTQHSPNHSSAAT
jgi:hypothetical protein